MSSTIPSGHVKPTDLGSVTVMTGTTAAINAVNRISKGGDPVPGLLASLILFVIFVFVGTLWRWDIVKALAAIMLLSTFLFRGYPLVNNIGRFINSMSQNVKRPVEVNATGSAGWSSAYGGSSGSGFSGGGGGGGGGGAH